MIAGLNYSLTVTITDQIYCLIVYTGLKYTYKIPKSFLGNRINLVHKNWQDYILNKQTKFLVLSVLIAPVRVY